ncbi:MAG: TetR/AcrR family transcriptional regulator [Clostridia bacterium]|nr:TetR/AcrR family transcriptional regulator [Clostridia bacterium]
MNKGINLKLHKAYAKLIKNNDDKITVTDLCEKADVARATFYLYYKSIDEFILKSKEYLIVKLYEQSELIMKASDAELDNVLKRKNIIFDDFELELLKYYTSGSNYLEFAALMNELLAPRYKNLMVEKWGEEFYEKNKAKFEFFKNAVTPLLYFNLLDYDESTIRYDMHAARNVANDFFRDIIDDIRKGNS